MAESRVTPSSESSRGDLYRAKSFKCNSCDRQFSRSENLRRHIRSHAPVQPHQCSFCDKQFSRSDLRRRHEATHAGSPSQRRRPPAVKDAEDRSYEFAQNDLRTSIELRPQAHTLPSTATSITSDRSLIPQHGSDKVDAQLNTSYHDPIEGTQQLASATAGVVQSLPPHHFNIDPSGDVEMGVATSQNHWPGNDPQTDFLNDWFDDDFYTAVLEMGADQGAPGFMTSDASRRLSAVQRTVFEVPQSSDGNSYQNSEPFSRGSTGIVSRVSSPPNEASEEDKWPYAWDPRSHGIMKAEPISISDSQPLLQSSVAEIGMSEQCYQRVRSFLNRAGSQGLRMHSLTMPSLAVANAFIALFFTKFEYSMPVIHRASISSLDCLPDPLLSVMIVIGAIYSRIKATRRFGIVLLDVTRLSLQLVLEIDNSLMREPLIIYAAALVCHTGLWCGNKRLFELSESLRGAAITFCRRNHFAGKSPSFRKGQTKEAPQGSVTDKWKLWVSEETRKRVCWVVYVLDCEITCLVYLPATISLNEMVETDCPCDEEFWQAASARKWKRLLGPASVPPSKLFISAIAPFLDYFGLLQQIQSLRSSRSSRFDVTPAVINLNSWTRTLVLLALHVQIFEFSQMQLLSIAAEEDIDYEDDVQLESTNINSVSDHVDTSTNTLESSDDFERCCTHLSGESRSPSVEQRKSQLESSLHLWSSSYMHSPPADVSLYEGSSYFHRKTVRLRHLADLLLAVSVQDIQNALGKAGNDGIQRAMHKLRHWATSQSQQGFTAVFNALSILRIIDPVKAVTNQSDGVNVIPNFGPHELISFFLASLSIWALVSNVDWQTREKLEQHLVTDRAGVESGFLRMLRGSLSSAGSEWISRSQDALRADGIRAECGNVILKYTADRLTQMGPWGASLNIALLLHQRAKM